MRKSTRGTNGYTNGLLHPDYAYFAHQHKANHSASSSNSISKMKSECSTSYSNNNGGCSTTELSYRQVERLRSVLNQHVEIHGRENFPTLEISLHQLIVHMRRKLREAGIAVKHVKMNGGAASFVLASDEFAYSDLDLIFPISLATEEDFDKVRCAVFDALIELMPDTMNKKNLSPDTLRDIYIRKMVKVSDGDRWSLFSLHNEFGKCIELKFVDKMRRAFEFSVDSFQITLDPMLDMPNNPRPIVKAESMFGDIKEAMRHLNKRLIDTRHPEEIRGGGLLKYCHLLTRGYRPTPNCRDMEKYMCSRFFIDFPDTHIQEIKLRSYLDNHFGNEDQMKYEYLQVLYRVIKESTICLMSHERRMTLAMVDRFRQHLSYSIQTAIENCYTCFTPRQTLLYLPPNSNCFIPVV